MANEQPNPETPDPTVKKVRLATQHTSGIIVPRWWRGNIAILIGIVAVVSVAFAAFTLNSASDRMGATDEDISEATEAKSETWHKSDEPPVTLPKDAVAHLFPDAEEMAQGEPVRAYEEALPEDLYESAPVILDPSGPRITVPEEYVPEEISDGIVQETPEPDQTALTSDELASLSPPIPDGEMPSTDEVAPLIELQPFEKELLEQQAWLANAIPFTPSDESLPLIAIVIDDMGVDRRRSPRAIALPGPLTMSFLTYARDLEAQTAAALEAGHELMIHIPMEPGSSSVDPGPKVLRVADSTETTLENLLWGLSQFDGYVGLNNHMGSKFTQDLMGMRAVLEEVRSRGLLFLDSRTAGGSVGEELANEIGVPFATRNVFLDHVDDEDEVRMRLAQTERLARKNGAAVAIGHPHDATLNVLAEWLPTVAEKGFLLAPMSAVVKRTWLPEQ